MNKYIIPGRDMYLAPANIAINLLGAFSTYLCIIPLILMDIIIWQFQNIYFRTKEIPYVDRKKYVIIDRYKL